MEVNIRGKLWQVLLLDNQTFKKQHGKNNAGITVFPERRIILNKLHFSPLLIKHELFHAFQFESCLEASDLTPIQVEEHGCEVFAHFAEEILELTDRILKVYS